MVPVVTVVFMKEPSRKRGFFALREEDGEGAVFEERPVAQRYSVLSGGEEHMQAARNSVCLAVLDELQRRAAASLLLRMSSPDESKTPSLGLATSQREQRMALLERWTRTASWKWVMV